jgi:DNA-binding NarL/FixJ family response regulator
VDVVEARAAYDARRWARAFALYGRAGDLDAADLNSYAVAALMTGRLDDYFEIRDRAYEHCLAVGDTLGAAEVALWVACQRIVQGEVGPGSGWLARATRLVEQDGTDSAASAFLGVAQALGRAVEGALDEAMAMTSAGVEACRRHGRDDLVALALHQEGLFLLNAGRLDEGLTRLDEAVVTLSSPGVTPMVAGIVYCGTISGCWSVYDLRRAHAWTAAMSEWCDAQPELGNFSSECKVRRAELKHLRGAWAEALQELAGVPATDGDTWAAGAAANLRGNLDRLHGRFDAAGEAFSVAGRLGTDPQPGLALLRLAQGSVQAAAAMIRRCLAETSEDARRVELLAAGVEILLAAGDQEAAELAADGLVAIADRTRIPLVQALAAQAQAQVLLDRDSAAETLSRARVALRLWVEVKAPYQEARVRVLLAEACRALGDVESAQRETELAMAAFEELGALPDLARFRDAGGMLTPRELEVIRLVVTGATNRAIAAHLVLSERTVDRHVSNIFQKLGVSTRAAATAQAFERGLV